MSTAKEIKYFEKVSKGINDGKYLNISTGREIDAKGKTAKDKFVDVGLKVAANTKGELEDFVAKYQAHGGRKTPSPVRKPPSPKRKTPSPVRRSPSPKRKTPSPVQRAPSPPKRKVQTKVVPPKGSPPKVVQPIRISPPRVVSPPKLPGYSNPNKCGPRNAYVCPDDKICNVATTNCVKGMRGKDKSVEEVINQLNKKVKMGGSKEDLKKAIESIQAEVKKAQNKPVQPPPEATLVITQPAKVVAKPRKISPPKRTSPPKRKSSPPTQARPKTPSPRRKTPSPVKTPVLRPKALVPGTPSPTRTTSTDTMSELVSTLSQVGKPHVSEATKKLGRPAGGDSPIPDRPNIPSVQTLGQQLNTQRTRAQIRQ